MKFPAKLKRHTLASHKPGGAHTRMGSSQMNKKDTRRIKHEIHRAEGRCSAMNPDGGQCLRDRRHPRPHQSYKGMF